MLSSIIKKIAGTKMVLIVRTDLKMGPGKIASQCAHAAITLYESAPESGAPLNQWLLMGQPKIVLKVDDENVLKELYSDAKKSELNVCMVYDAGKTQVDWGTLTVVGIGPNSAEEIDRLTKHLKLL